MDLLRFSTAGSVDDGKSTLIGRLLYDSKGAYEDQLAALRRADGLDLALLTDGLRAEREQGITIDVAYRYFATPRRKFIIADTPGHEQYTRNMATGASTADLAIILVDARLGVLPQTRRHASIAALLGIPHLVVAVNKMDLVEFRREVFEAIRADLTAFTQRLEAAPPHFIPLSALEGDNVVSRSEHMPWYEGPSLLEYLEQVPVARNHAAGFRFPVQYVVRPNLDFRGYAGQVVSGEVRPGDPIAVLPSGRETRVKSIVTWEGELEHAFAPMSVTLCLEDHIDLGRGDMLASAAAPPHVSRRIEANVVWMSERPLKPHRAWLVKHNTRQVRAAVREIRHRLNIETLAHEPAAALGLNEIGVVAIETHTPLCFDSYRCNRATGAFILIDPMTNETAGAGMILNGNAATRANGRVTAAERASRLGHPALTLWLRGGAAELAQRLERRLFESGCLAHILEPRMNAQARTLNAAGVIAICRGHLPPPGAIELAGPEEEMWRAIEERLWPSAFGQGEGI
jgi:sulfate adenylyltransferase large subunit